jgi:hypothetical protein
MDDRHACPPSTAHPLLPNPNDLGAPNSGLELDTRLFACSGYRGIG